MLRKALLGSLIALLTGCVTTSTQTTFVVRQAGLTPGVSAPLISGPGLPAGSWSITAGGQTGNVIAGSSRDQGGLGSVVANEGGRVAAAYSWKNWDIAAAVELRPASLAKTTATDVPSNEFGNALMVYPTFAGRWRIQSTERMQFGLIMELSVPNVPYSRQTQIASQTTTTNSNGSSQQSDWTGTAVQWGSAWLPIFRTGPVFSWKWGPVFGLTVGMLVMNEPYVQGVSTAVENCTNGACSGSTANDIPAFQYALAAVPFVSPTLDFGHLRITGQVFANLASNTQLTAAAAGGAELMVTAWF